MGQRLRVVGWLRFGNKAQLTKGLRAFAENEAPGYYEADAWSVEGLDAHIRLDVELPGDFDNVERPFLGMSWASAYGYVDYFEDGNDKIHGGPQNGPLKRWNTGHLNRQLKWVSPYGTSGLAYPRGDVILTVSGRLRFDEASDAEKALGSLPLRLPYLDREGARELRLGADVVRREGGEIVIEAAIEAPTQVVEPLNEVFRMLAAKAKTGKITLREPSWTSTAAAGSKKIERASLREKPVAGEATPVHTVDATAPIVRAAEAPPAEAKTSAGKKKATAKAAATDDVTLEGHPGGIAGAALLPGGRLAAWGGRSVSFFEADLSLAYTGSIATEIDSNFAWPVNGVVGLGARMGAGLVERDWQSRREGGDPGDPAARRGPRGAPARRRGARQGGARLRRPPRAPRGHGKGRSKERQRGALAARRADPALVEGRARARRADLTLLSCPMKTQELKAVGRARRRRARLGRLLLVVTGTIGLASIGMFLTFPGLTPFHAGRPTENEEGAQTFEAPRPPAGPPVVRVHDGSIELDGVVLAQTAGIDRVQRIVPLYDALKSRRIEARATTLEAPPVRIILAIGTDVSAVVAKCVYQTAAFAGYSEVAFMLPDGSLLEQRP